MARTVLPYSPNCRATRPTARTLTGQPHCLFEALAKRCLARQLRHLFCLHPAIRTAHPLQLHHHRRPKLETGQVAYLSLVRVISLAQLPPAAGAHQFPVPTLAPNPQLQRFRRLIDFVSVDPVPRPPRTLLQSVSLILPSLTRVPKNQNPHKIRRCYRFSLRTVFPEGHCCPN